MAKTKETDEPPVIDINGDAIDLRPAIPFKISAWRKLKAAKGVDLVTVGRMHQKQEMEMGPLIEIAVAAIQMVRPQLTAEVIEDALTFADVNKIVGAVMASEVGEKPDRPTSTGSSPSPSDGAGAPATSAA